jgi:transcriptional regulator with XRE-family HTH domain
MIPYYYCIVCHKDRTMPETDLPRRIATRLRQLRKSAGLTRAHLAARVGCHRETIVNIESGRRLPSLRLLVRLARALGVGAGALLD